MDGILNIHKATGMTSHDVVAKIRKLLQEKRVGHAGTLDPLASGVLPICVGQATRVAEYLSESGKAYLATIVFGTVTDTYDAEGTILRTANTDHLTLQMVEEALEHFVGPQMQMPPRYSAIKLQGQPAYKRVRAGEEIKLAPRPVVIHSLEIAPPGRDKSGPYATLQGNPPSVTLAIECGKGTYIRSLAYDLGEYLGCGAYLATLVRTRSGPFHLSESVTLEQLSSALAEEVGDHSRVRIDPARGITLDGLFKYLYPADKALEGYPALVLDAATVERVQHGNAFHYLRDEQVLPTNGIARVYSDDGHFVAIAKWDAAQEVWQPRKVFRCS
ncbi:MAG TPA: tRNA pseudouridine(55) synthase TruB [Ktedonobacteraceae bacterium]|nr:tRNA pseudouridine(55) synthase TruB [Ktedonobacteraceae bacterium]